MDSTKCSTQSGSETALTFRPVEMTELNTDLFSAFIRRQEVSSVWTKATGEWRIVEEPYLDDWSQADYETLCEHLRTTLSRGGAVFGAFSGEKIKAFVSVESVLYGSAREYLDMPYLHVSRELRKQGVGRKLIGIAADWAKRHGAKKLYISANSSVETQAFYRAVGCVEAKEYDPEHVLHEPWDCQMEMVL